MDFVGAAKPLNSVDIANEANALGVEVASVWAVCEVEAASSGFLPDNRPKILFEAHSFHTLTRGIYDRSYPNISSATWDRSLYGHSGAHQYDRLAVAIGLNREAGLESASWGRFQIMGYNFENSGFGDVESFVEAIMDDEANHLSAFGNFCTNTGLLRYLRSHDWEHFALHYNGPGNVADYAGKLASAYDRHNLTNPGTPPFLTPTTLRRGSTGPLVVHLQEQLNKLGCQLPLTGTFGPKTEAAVRDFQTKHNLYVDGVVGPTTQTILSQVS